MERCSIQSSSQMTCPTPTVTPELKVKGVWFQLDNVRVHYESIKVPAHLSVYLPASLCLCLLWLRPPGTLTRLPARLSVPQGRSFTYYPNPEFSPLNREAPDSPYRFKPGGVIAVEVTCPPPRPQPPPTCDSVSETV